MINWKDDYRGVVHLSSGACGGEFTLCGYAYDEPSSEHGAEVMRPTTEAVTCEYCISEMRTLLPYLKSESRKLNREGR